MLPEACEITGQVMFIPGAGQGTGKGIAPILASSASDNMTGQTLCLGVKSVGMRRT
jgi:cell division GTPase FtsZ